MVDESTKQTTIEGKLELLSSDVFWFPAGMQHSLLALPDKRGLFIASSRLSRKLDDYPQLFDALRTVAMRLDPAKHFLISSGGTTCDRFVNRISELFDIPVVRVEPMPTRTSKRWKELQIGNSSSRPSGSRSELVFVKQDKSQSIDRLLMSMAEDVLLLSVKSNGNVERGALERLAKTNGSQTRILIDRKLTSRATQDRLIESGAVAWWLFDDSKENSDGKDASPDLEPRVLTLSEFQRDEFLLHWTRRCVGPWPDQSENQFLDDLIFGYQRKNHHEVATLFRILATQRLLSSNRLTRDERKVVCFSHLDLERLPERRVFRSHLSRWDFEPYGIAIEKNWLAEQGARKVIYGDDQVWNELDDHDRPYFQLSSQKSQSIDWTAENEWRMTGDLDLRRVPMNAAVAFVPDRESADLIAPVCRWPIVVLG
jgi:hypothetical protein